MKKLLLVLILVGALALPVLAQYQVGDPVPMASITLRNYDGQFINLGSFPTRIKFLVFWSWN